MSKPASCPVPPNAWFKRHNPVQHIEFPRTIAGKRRFHKQNLLKLAELMERVPEENHDQGIYMDNHNLTVDRCGTAHCALGWAITSGEFPGLQWSYYRDDPEKTYPVVNGFHTATWAVAVRYFGQRSTAIFGHGGLNKTELIGRLQAMARDL